MNQKCSLWQSNNNNVSVIFIGGNKNKELETFA